MSTSPGAGALDLRVLISAQNTASPEFAKVQKDATDTAKVLQDVGKTVSSSVSPHMHGLATETELTGRSLREVLGPLRLFSSSIASEVSPALGGMVSGLGAASREGARFSLTFAASIVAITTAATGIALYIQRLNALTNAQAEANFAAKGFDASPIRGQLDAAIKAMDEFQLSWKQKFLSNFGQTGAPDWLGALFGKPDPAILEAQKRALATALPFETALAQAQQLAAFRQAEIALSQLQAARAEQTGDMELFSALEDKIAAALDLESVALQKVIALEAELLRIRAERRGTLDIENQGITDVEDVRRRTELFRSDSRLRALEFARTDAQRRQSELVNAVTAESRPLSEEEEGFTVGQLAIRDIRRQAASSDAELTSARAQAQTQLVGLSRQRRVEMELISIEAARQFAFAQAEGKENQEQLKAMADIRAAMQAQLAIEQELQRTNPIAGFALGIQQVVDDFTSAGELMRSGIHELGQDMARSLSTNFFDVVTGGFKKLSDLPKAFGESILRTMSDVVSKMVVGNILGSIQQSFRGGFGSFLPGAGMLAGGVGGGSGGGGLLQIGGQLFQQVTAGGGQTVLVPAGAAGVGAGGGGGFNLASFPNIPTGNFGTSLLSGTNFGAMLNAPLSALLSSDVVFSGGQLISNAGELASLGISSSGIAGESAFAGAGISLGSAASGIAAGIGLGLTIWSALQGPPTFQNIAISTVSGAGSGAAAGALIGTLINPGAGTVIGAVIGAVAGGAGGGLAAAFGKGGLAKKPSPAERSYQVALAGRANLSGAIDAAASLEQLVQILNTKWSPNYEVNIAAWEFGPTDPRYNSPGNRALALVEGGAEPARPFVLEMMLADSRYVDNLDIQVAGPGGSGTAATDFGLTRKFQAKWTELLLALAKATFGFREDFGPLGEFIGAAPSATGFASIERLSVLSGSQLFGRGQGQQLEVSPDVLKRSGLTDDQVEQFLRMAWQVDRDRNLNILVRPEQFAF